jgi:cell division septum initiation protein DivIVA
MTQKEQALKERIEELEERLEALADANATLEEEVMEWEALALDLYFAYKDCEGKLTPRLEKAIKNIVHFLGIPNKEGEEDDKDA